MKCGLKTFPLAVDLDDSVKYIEAEFGMKGFAVVIKLHQAIYSRGYYMKWDIDAELLFIRDYCLSEIGRNLVSEIVTRCVKRGVFDTELFEKFNILTSKRIQETFLTATKRSKQVIFEKEYALPIVYIFIANASKNDKNVNISFKNADISKQRKEKERKGNNLSNTCDSVDEDLRQSELKSFLKKYPNLAEDETDISIIDFSLLDKHFKQSNFLQGVTSLKWVVENYDKVVSGKYKNFNKQGKAFENQRSYSKEELDSLVDEI